MPTEALKFSKRRQIGLRQSKADREQLIIKKVRAEVFDRDQGCRFPQEGRDDQPCYGPLEWAHLPEYRRSRTMGQDPMHRHTTSGTVCLCRLHHGLLDRNRMRVVVLSDEGANGQLQWSHRDGTPIGVS